MAKKKTHHKAAASRALVVRAAPSRPLVLKQTRTIIKKSKRHAHRHARSALGGLLAPHKVGIALGAGAIGLLVKSGLAESIPRLPVLGMTGTIAVAAHFLSDNGKNKLFSDIAMAGMALAAYELATAGQIVGDDYVAGTF